MVFRQYEILRAGLAKNPQALLLRTTDFLHAFAVGDMHDHDRRIDDLGEADGAVGRFPLGGDWPRQGMRQCPGAALRFQPVGQELDDVVAFGMDHDERIVSLGDAQDLQHLAVGDLQIVVGHEDLERAVAFLDQGGKLLPQDLRGRVGDDQVDGIVDETAAFSLGAIGGKRRAEALPLLLQAEGHDRGVAADSGRAAAGKEIVGRHDARTGWLRQVDMAVYAAWHDQQAGCVDDLGRIHKPVGDGGDPAVADAEVGAKRVSGSDDGAVADHGVEMHQNVSRSSATKCPLPTSSIGAQDGCAPAAATR